MSDMKTDRVLAAAAILVYVSRMSDILPNILFIMSDDHASHAMSCYGSRINTTPNLDRIAKSGMRFDNCFCTNSICTPSRATILTGTYNHVNGVTTLATHMDNRLQTFPKLLQAQGYQTAMIGKWHLGQGPAHWPTGFDYWNVLPGQGLYHDPVMVEMGQEKVFSGYTTDLITDFSIDWIKKRDKSRPFCLMCHHKAPHRPWQPDQKHAHMYENIETPYPETFDDDYANRAIAAEAAAMRVESDMTAMDLKIEPLPGMQPRDRLPVPETVKGYVLKPLEGKPVSFESHADLKKWKYQRYIKDYLRCVASIDDNVGRLLDHLDAESIADNTIVVYTSDQGFFLGDHGWYDKRFMYEESLRMPYIMRYPNKIPAGTVNSNMILNVDFAETFLDYAGSEIPGSMQGRSFRPLLEGSTPQNWRTAMYYRYWMHGAHHNICAHYGIRTLSHKLIYYYGKALGQQGADTEPVARGWQPEWELFDLENDPRELNSVYSDQAYAHVVARLKEDLHRLQAEVGDKPVAELG